MCTFHIHKIKLGRLEIRYTDKNHPLYTGRNIDSSIDIYWYSKITNYVVWTLTIYKYGIFYFNYPNHKGKWILGHN